MKSVWVVGAGQLGAMLRQAGNPLGVRVTPIDATQPLEDLAQLSDDDVVTPEIEAWPASPITDRLAQHPQFVNRDVFPIIADRYTQKKLLDKLEIPTADWFNVTEQTSESELHAALGERVLLKRRKGGYDGRGQHWLESAKGSTIPEEFRNHSIAEKAIPFDEEVSIIGARDYAGQFYFYPLSLNRHVNGILKASVAALPRLSHLQAQAEANLRRLMEHLDYVGVMAMECFRLGDRLMVNELAPRVHNSGHWTQAGASISQFDYHVRAVVGLPLAPAVVKGTTVMINLVGVDYDPRWLTLPGAELYWYQKAVRPGRKVGHINFCQPQREVLQQLASFMPAADAEVIDWVIAELD